MLSTDRVDEFIEGSWNIQGDEYTCGGYFDLEEVLENRDFDPSKDAYGPYKPVHILGLGTVMMIEDYYGGGDHSDHMHIVFRLDTVDGSSRLFRKDGFYSDDGDSEYDADLREVYQRDKTVIVYE